VFKTEKGLIAHACEPRNRHLQRDDKHVTLGFMAYQRYFERINKKPPAYESFCKNKLYTDFIKFGRHLIELNAINTRGFIDFLLHVEAKVHTWTSPALYQTYIRELTKNETPMEALNRSLTLMQRWADDHDLTLQDFFASVATPQAVLLITNGRLSPWMLFIASGAHDLMQRMNAEQLAIIERSIDPEFWRLKIERHQAEVAIIRDVLIEQGI
jgi:hypothetical protein